MSEVIYVDFSRPTPEQETDEKLEYVHGLIHTFRQKLCDDDFADLIDALRDQEHYAQCDEVIQCLANRLLASVP
jgi:hypothetical protein